MSEEFDELFAQVSPHIKPVKRQNKDVYGRGKDYNWEAVKADIAAGFRICTRCDTKKTIDNFSVRSAHITGYKAWCKECDSAAWKAHHQNNKEQLRAKDRAKHYERKYGLDPALSKILSDPENRISTCPICREVDRLVLDHDHTTGQVRALLCSSCNTLLGFAKDSIDILYEAIAYLKKHKGV